jgi:hypothetical protein
VHLRGLRPSPSRAHKVGLFACRVHLQLSTIYRSPFLINKELHHLYHLRISRFDGKPGELDEGTAKVYSNLWMLHLRLKDAGAALACAHCSVAAYTGRNVSPNNELINTGTTVMK